MNREITGPELLRRVKSICFFDSDHFGHAKYTYVDDAGKRTPEYAATHIKITAYYARMSDVLVDQLALDLSTLPGGTVTAMITGHATLRPQVVAIFNRQAAVA